MTLVLIAQGQSRSRNEADTISLTECRIIYKKSDHLEENMDIMLRES